MTNKETIALEAKTKRINRKFQKATPAQRRVMIAKDALEQINAEKFVPRTGTWTSVRLGNGCEAEWREPLQPALLDPKTECRCCGVGSLFLSYVRINNKATAEDGGGYSSIRDTINWPAKNLRLIELAFEHGLGCMKVKNTKEQNMVEKYSDHCDRDRLLLILTNIIKNRGTFKP